MSIGTEVFIQTTTVEGQIVTSQVTQTIIGVPGGLGAQGLPGVDGADGVGILGSYVVAAAPDPTSVGSGSIIYVPNEIDGPVIAYTDGFAWRRTTDRSIIYAPPVGASLDLNFVGRHFSVSPDTNPANIAGTHPASILLCTRATTAFAESVDGTLSEFVANALRITDKGLLVENAGTNSITYSNDLSKAIWQKINGSSVVSGTGQLGPDGTTSGDMLSIPSINAEARHAVSHTPLAGEDWTFSVWLRGLAGETVTIYISRTVGGPYQLTQKDVVLTNNWKRFSVTHSFAAGPTNIFAGIKRGNTTTAASVEVWGAQFEQASQVSSLIKTAGAAGTRAADVMQFSEVAWSNTATGTVLIETNESQGHDARMFYGGSALDVFFNTSAVSLTWSGLTPLLSGLTQFDAVKTALAWDATGRSIVSGGGTLLTDAAATTLSTPLYLGNQPTIPRALDGYIRSITYWPTRKTDVELSALAV